MPSNPRDPKGPVWAIARPTGVILLWSIRNHRDEALQAIVSFKGYAWGRLYRNGYRAIRVEVRALRGGSRP